ncbi:polysaccharide pyruvyl transferase family protein, partial [Thioclava sp. BHET1]
MKIVQFGLRYSPNTGDGVIAECIAHGLRGLRPDAEVTMIDMSGRDDFGAVTVRNRDMALRILQALPLVLRQALVRWRLGRLLDRAVPVWARQLDGADMALIGGGQIFSDADLNFCLKIARVSDLLEARQIPVAIHAVGVSQNWTRAGKALFETIWTTDLRRVGPRDQGSLRAWIAQMGSRLPA